MANTTLQRIIFAARAIVTGGVVGAQAGGSVNHLETGGTFVLNGVTPVTVVEPKVTANSSVVISLKTVGGTVGALPAIQTITVGTGFTIQGTAADTSIYQYLVIG